VSLLLSLLLEAASATVPLVGIYLHGSLVLDDFQDGQSDIDVVAVLQGRLGGEQRERLAHVHVQLIADESRAQALHCAYVDSTTIADVTQEHPAWAHGEMLSRPLSVFARRELLAVGRAVAGPPVESVVPRWTEAAMAEALRADRRYWGKYSRSPRLWRQDIWVDIGMTSAVRERVWAEERRVISKSEAISRMPGLGVAGWLVADLQLRRVGQPSPLGSVGRVRRMCTAPREVRRLMPGLDASAGAG
jgi:hypothetical protein